MDFQFFPTPEHLASRLWAKFKNKDFVRVLEPSAGEGHLAMRHPWVQREHHWGKAAQIDCIEIDVTKHAVLQSKGFTVIGVDFMQLQNAAGYSHVVMNPPFSRGASHVLKAWDLLWDGEIAAIINAETIRNPFSQERQSLVRLIENFGEVEFVDEAFMVPDAERKTSVSIAIVYLRKVADTQNDITGDLLSKMSEDFQAKSLGAEYQKQQELAVPNTTIENAVLLFNAAVAAMKLSIFAGAKSSYYRGLLGDTLAVRNGDIGRGIPSDATVSNVRGSMAVQYDELKDRAWAGILRSANVTDKLSSKTRQRVEKEFEKIKRLEFTVSNIYGFLLGISENQGKIQAEMACDVFDRNARQTSPLRAGKDSADTAGVLYGG